MLLTRRANRCYSVPSRVFLAGSRLAADGRRFSFLPLAYGSVRDYGRLGVATAPRWMGLTGRDEYVEHG